MKKGGMAGSEVHEILRLIGIYGCIEPFPKKEIDAKIKSILDREKSRTRAWQEEVRELLVTTSGDVTTTNVYNWLQVTTRDEKKSVIKALSRLADEGLLKKSQTVAGKYRIVSNDSTVKDWKHAKTETLDFNLPLGIDEAIRVRPGSIILFAGVTNTGKTAFSMQTIALNKDRKFHYFSSEIEEDEFKERAMNYSSLEDWDCEFIDGWNPMNIEDIIIPDGFNVIDYLEPPEGDYTLMATKLTDIHRALNKGIAIVCLQKKKDVEYGAGGEFMASKPHLYCTLDIIDYPECQLMIKKCKTPKKGYKNPGGMSIKYVISRNGITVEAVESFKFEKWGYNV